MEFAAITVYSQMSSERLLQTVTSILIMAGYAVSERCGLRPRSFDLIARKGDAIVVIKVVVHIDSMSEEIAHELAAIAHFLKGKPLVIGEKARDSSARNNILTGKDDGDVNGGIPRNLSDAVRQGDGYRLTLGGNDRGAGVLDAAAATIRSVSFQSITTSEASPNSS